MSNIVSITSQGQISIPAKIRRELGLDKSRKALVTAQRDKIIIEPVQDLLMLRGSLKTNIKATPQKVRKAFEKYLGEQASKVAG